MYRIKTLDMPEKLYQAIKKMILENKFQPGDNLNQEKLANHFGVSRTPLLSAFSKLEKDMLIDIFPRRGAFVKKLTFSELYNLYDIRLRLEPYGASEAAEKRLEKDIASLKKILDSFDNKNNFKEYNYNFHMAIIRMSDNEFLFRMLSSFNILIISNTDFISHKLNESINTHKHLYEAIKNHDKKQAGIIMYEQIYSEKELLKGAR